MSTEDEFIVEENQTDVKDKNPVERLAHPGFN